MGRSSEKSKQASTLSSYPAAIIRHVYTKLLTPKCSSRERHNENMAAFPWPSDFVVVCAVKNPISTLLARSGPRPSTGHSVKSPTTIGARALIPAHPPRSQT
jgi:hypothetical protein